MNFITQWSALYVCAGYEQKVIKSLKKRNVQYYFPISNVMVKFDGRIEKTSQPLFPNYIFVRLEKMDLKQLKKISGVSGIVYWLKKPAVFQNIDIEMIDRFLNEHKSVQLKRISVSLSELSRIVDSMHPEQNGEKCSINNRQIQLILPSMGWVVSAKTEKVEVINEEHNSIQQITPNVSLVSSSI